MTTRPITPPTPLGRSILRWIDAYCVARGFSPTFRELCDAFGWKSPNAAAEHLRRLARRQLVDVSPGLSRTMRVTDAGRIAMEEPKT